MIFEFKKNRHLVGLDIGSRAIKAAELIDTKKGYTLKNFAVADIASGIIEDGNIQNHEELAETIRNLMDTYRFKNQNIALSIGGYSVIVKKISIQSVPEEQLQDAISLEAEQYIPFDIQDVSIDFQVLGKNESNPNQMNILLVAAKKEVVNEYAQVVEMAGLTPCILDIDAFALQNAFELNYPATSENIALIDIGATKTSLNIVRDVTSLFMRDVSQGCSQINQKIVHQLGCSAEEAEEIKLSGASEKIQAEEYEKIISSVVINWCLEIRRALDFFYSSAPNDPVRRIILSGGGAHIKTFRDLLAMETSTAVEIINPFKNIIVDKNHFDSTYLDMISPQAAICMGLSMRRLDDK
jgi:type IV pilus assembly protein PilM